MTKGSSRNRGESIQAPHIESRFGKAWLDELYQFLFHREAWLERWGGRLEEEAALRGKLLVHGILALVVAAASLTTMLISLYTAGYLALGHLIGSPALAALLLAFISLLIAALALAYMAYRWQKLFTFSRKEWDDPDDDREWRE